jgi:hypothetical protein
VAVEKLVDVLCIKTYIYRDVPIAGGLSIENGGLKV